MIIHTVQKEDTVNSIAEKYNIPVSRLEKDNDLAPYSTLSEGQALMITYPTKTYIVKYGDTLESIANTFGVTKIELLRNNPQLSDTNSLTAGTELVISYDNKEKQIYVNGFANTFINIKILKKTLPFLTYITILNYKILDDGGLTDIPDEDIIKVSREYGVAPIMFISAFDVYGVENHETIHNLLNNMEIKVNLIQSTLNLLKRKDYYGLYLGFQHILKDDLHLYTDFVKAITDSMNQEGYEVFVSLIPSTFDFTTINSNIEPYFSEIGQAANYVTLLTYQWMSSTISQFSETGTYFLDKYVSYAVTQIPPEKIYLGLDRIAYDWAYPYTEEKASGNFISDSGALNLANQYNATIYLEEASQAPYYYYTDLAGLEHFIWYKDARTVNSIVNLIYKHDLKGIAIWNVMYYFSPTFIVINAQYDIVSVLNNTAKEPL
ncbi:MAG: LysM peptidoglycan-binding domain-containing protein [Anaerocolumna sp.]